MVAWLSERSVDAVRAALRTVAPDIATGDVVLHDGWVNTGNPLWSRSSAFVDGSWVVKFAWSEPAARKLVREARAIEVIGSVEGAPPVATLRARSSDPAMFVAPMEHGRPLAFEITGSLDGATKRRIGEELGAALASLHRQVTLAAVIERGLDLPAPTPQADTASLRERLAPLLDPARADLLLGWCDWTDAVLAEPAEPVLLHGDFHGYNAIFDEGWRLRRVLDLEECSVGDRHYDFRYLPAQEPTVELLRHTVLAYEDITRQRIDIARVMAWHIRTVCGDALWRTEARIDLPGGGTPSQWIDELEVRLSTLGVSTRGRRRP